MAGAPDPAPGGVRAEVQLDSGDLEVNPLVDPDAGWIDLGGPGMYEVEAYQPEDGHYVFRIWNPAGGPHDRRSRTRQAAATITRPQHPVLPARARPGR